MKQPNTCVIKYTDPDIIVLSASEKHVHITNVNL